MPHVTQFDINANQQGFCCAECGKELVLGESYREAREPASDTVSVRCLGCCSARKTVSASGGRRSPAQRSIQPFTRG